MVSKKCSTCGESKPESLFNKNRAQLDGYCNECRGCAKQRGKEYHSSHKEARKVYYINKRKEEPWWEHVHSARSRCTSKAHIYYKCGIKFLMKPDDFKKLWFRDKAYLMKRPSIDRLDPDGNYEYSNCRFLELFTNISRKRYRKGSK